MTSPLEVLPIGTIRTPFVEKAEAPRQSFLAGEVAGKLVLEKGRSFEDALSDLEGWEYLWVVYWFDRNKGWRPKVLPPRSARKRRGVFATRSPHRPNPIGISVVKLVSLEGLTVHVRGVDMLDRTPLLDIKPYVPAADAFPTARTGWLEPLVQGDGTSEASPERGLHMGDPEPGFEVVWSDEARAQAAWLKKSQATTDLVPAVERVLTLGPQPHAYRRITPDGDAMKLAVKDWRVRFRAAGRRITVLGITSGYRAKELATGEGSAIDLHRSFLARFS